MVAEILDEEDERIRSGGRDRIGCPVLVTERLLLRAPHDEDVTAIANLADNIRVAEMLRRMPSPYTREHAQDFVRRAKAGEIGKCVYSITLANNGAFIGCCGLHDHGHGLEIGYWLGEPYWGLGYATEAAHGLIDVAFRSTDLDRLHAACRVKNLASRRVIHKCGFQYVGMGMMESPISGNVPIERYTLDRKTWIGLRSWGA